MADNISVLDSAGATQTMRAVDNAGIKTAVHILADPTGTPVTPGAATSLVSTANSTSTPLAGGAAFTGTSENVQDYAVILVNVFADQVSATDGLSIQQSSNGTNWDIQDNYTMPAMAAGQGKTYSVQVAARFFRVVYTNGATIQGAFRLQCVYHQRLTKASSVRPQDGRSNEIDVEEIAAYNAVFNGTTWDRARGDATNGLWVNVKATITQPTKEVRSTTGTVTTVAASATNVTLLASNANRLGATIINELGSAALYLKLGATASNTSYTLQVAAGGYYEVPANYTGQIDGIWASALGNSRITELT